MSKHQAIRAALFAAVALLSACAPTVDDVCADIDDSCGDFDSSQCTSEGQHIQDIAEDSRCEPLFFDHLDCVAEAGCSWHDACSQQSDVLFSCLDEEFGPD